MKKYEDDIIASVADSVRDVIEGKVKEEAKYPHDMFDPKTGEKEVAKDEAEHKALAKKGYTHDKPEVDEVAEPKAKGEKEFKGKHKVKKSGEKEDGSVVKEESIDEVAAKVDPKAMAASIPQMKLSKFLKKATKKSKVYFDGADLVDVDKTVVRGALDPKKKISVQKLIDALTEDLDEAVDKKLVKKAVDIALKMSGNMTNAVKKIEKMKKGLSKEKEVAAALQLANEEVSEAVLDDAHAMNTLLEDKAKYKAFFNKALKKFGVKSPGELEGDKKKEFFDYVDAGYEADNEED
jgi:hypothetical protein